MKRFFACVALYLSVLAIVAGLFLLGGLGGAVLVAKRLTEDPRPAFGAEYPAQASQAAQPIPIAARPVPLVPQMEMLVIAPGTSVVGNFSMWEEEGLVVSADKMFLALSSSEHLEFKSSHVVRYICIEPREKARKAFFEPDVSIITAAKAGYGYDGYISVRGFNIYGNEKVEGIELAKLTIKTDGKLCKVTYSSQEKKYSLRCRKDS